MEALEIEGQTDQTPLASGSLLTAQRELAEAQHLFDDPDHRFYGAFACTVDRFAQSGLELVRHLDLGVSILGRRIGQRSKTLLPAQMMGITTRSNVGFDTAFRTRSQRRGTKIPSVQRSRIGRADR